MKRAARHSHIFSRTGRVWNFAVRISGFYPAFTSPVLHGIRPLFPGSSVLRMYYYSRCMVFNKLSCLPAPARDNQPDVIYKVP